MSPKGKNVEENKERTLSVHDQAVAAAVANAAAEKIPEIEIADIAARDEELTKRRRELGVADDVAGIEGLTPVVLVALGEKGVKTRDDLADLAGDELIEIVPPGSLTIERANEIIMAARAHWFADDVKAGTAEGETHTA